MGSRSKIDLAYIAGFLDGDGSLMFQLKKRKDGKKKWRLMCTVCFYQDSRHDKTLHWIRDKLNIGYVSKRNDGMSELRVNGFKQIRDILKDLLPFVKFKRVQANAMHKATTLLSKKHSGQLNENELIRLVDYILEIQEENYATKRKKSKKELLSILGLTP